MIFDMDEVPLYYQIPLTYLYVYYNHYFGYGVI